MLYSLAVIGALVAVFVKGQHDHDHDHMCNYWWSSMWTVPLLAEECYPYGSNSYMCSCESTSTTTGTVMMYNDTSCSTGGTTVMEGICYCGGEDCLAEKEYNTLTNVTCASSGEIETGSANFPAGCYWNEGMTSLIEISNECPKIELSDGDKVKAISYTYWWSTDGMQLPSTNCTWYETMTEAQLLAMNISLTEDMIGGEECHSSTEPYVLEVTCSGFYSTPSFIAILMVFLVAAAYN